jgi:hypothetical protein
MYFLKVGAIEILPDFQMTSMCVFKSINLQCLQESHRCEMLRYLKYLGEWCQVKIMVYDEQNVMLSLWGTQEQLGNLLNEFLCDFQNPHIPISYLYRDRWYSFGAVNNTMKDVYEDTFMTF